jgi:Na+/melibiose symporter-like transporter
VNYLYSPIYIITVLLLSAIGAGIYFTPAIIARGKKNSGTIFLCNLFFGVTGVGWIVCLIWAIHSEYEYYEDVEEKLNEE